jgi:predicted nucleic acid-binding protein
VIVLDASAFVAAVAEGGRRGRTVKAALAAEGHWAVPEHFALEVVNAFRGLWLGRVLDDAGFEIAVEAVQSAELDVWPSRELLPRIRQLASNATAYDAAYLALAEDTGAILLTTDPKLARVPGIRCRVVVAE